MPIIYFQTTQDPLDLSLYILEHSNNINSKLADNLFRKKLYETHKKDIPALLNYHYKRCDEPSEFADHLIELLEVALDENQDVKFLKSLSFWGDPEKAKRYKRRTSYALEYLYRMNDSEPNDANIIRFPFNGEKIVLADLFSQLIALELPDGKKAIPLSRKAMARCLNGIAEPFSSNKVNSTYEYFRARQEKWKEETVRKSTELKFP
ncbi:MAG: hypothetical protein KAQ62_28780 [Cyclobacteriaceae bacterium]|nr:hypothetical protein [Cyclobacteriaceae bacterium]